MLFKKKSKEIKPTNHLNLLGLRAKDLVTGYEGVITTISYDLYGCVQAAITPKKSEGDSSKLDSGHWFDVTRLDILSELPVMRTPDFNKGYVAEGKKGCSNKPSF